MSAKYFDDTQGNIKDHSDEEIISAPDSDGNCMITVSSGRPGERLATSINLRLLVRFVQHHFCDQEEDILSSGSYGQPI